MINKVVLVGRLTKDPDLKYSGSGTPVVRFTLAVNRTFTNQNGQREADFINCVSFRRQAENVNRFVRKGSLVGVEGRIQTGSYEAQDGSRRYTTDVICDSVQFLESRNSQSETVDVQNTYNNNNNYNQGQNNQGFNQNRGQQPRNNANMGQGQAPNQQQQKKNNNIDDDPYFSGVGNVDISEDDLPF
ncbi:single-stranded DNA-binding protein [Haloplasma contractile]|uniref:Single-stranded DNA-binding protein n=1 Tax=Haloplasma contractile SSD-17B TaxID=1033810 RepID=U2EED0_9MOLU|nr:single-stranded DNA-binding protein [Haloplasma contractile]ERJ13343.1 Single-stranded DNA-binding protein 1 [Haloplasma contractile SSD-17B]